MKRFKKIVALAAATAIALLPNVSTLQVSAAEPTTYYARFDLDQGDWRVQVGTWDNKYEGREPYYLNEGDEKMKDGDILVIMPTREPTDDDGEPIPQATGSDLVVNVRLSNLTVNRAGVVIKVPKGIDECHVFGDSYAAVTANVANAYIYDNGTCTFHGNVTNVRMIAVQKNDVETTVSVTGTVKYASTANAGGILCEYYDFKAGSFDFDGITGLMTDDNLYSKSGNGPSNAPATASAPAAASTTSAPAKNNDSSAYDNVPKTGEDNVVVWLFGASALCAVGSVALKKARKY